LFVEFMMALTPTPLWEKGNAVNDIFDKSVNGIAGWPGLSET
jgi:hypothetical protein